MKRFRLLLLAAAFGLVSAASASAIGPICRCPDNVAPVLCPNGHVYGNACLAGCAGQTNCVRTEI